MREVSDGSRWRKIVPLMKEKHVCVDCQAKDPDGKPKKQDEGWYCEDGKEKSQFLCNRCWSGGGKGGEP